MSLDVTEKQLQETVLDMARLLGWATYHTFDSRRSTAGFPDLVLARNGRILFVELKAKGKKPTEAQQAWLDVLDDCTTTSQVWCPSDMVLAERMLR